MILDVVSLIANALTVVASSIAIYVFFRKGEEIRTAFSLLLNWTFQLTLTDLEVKLERLNEYNANEPSEIDEIRNIMHEIAGQIRGNHVLVLSLKSMADKLETLANGKKLTEPLKRSAVSELREKLRNLEVNTIAERRGAEDV